MRTLAWMLVVALLTFLPTPAQSAPLIITWDAVTTDVDGQPLGSGLEVKGYHIYQCGPGVGNCTRATATKIGTVTAPVVEFDITAQPTPVTYFVTAFNVVGESTESNRLKVTKSSAPGNLRIK